MEENMLQLTDRNCKPVHDHLYTVPGLAEQQWHQGKKI
jgi:hypothetical protein